MVYYLHNQEGLDMKKYIATLAEDEREALVELASRASTNHKKSLDSLILLGCDEGGLDKTFD